MYSRLTLKLFIAAALLPQLSLVAFAQTADQTAAAPAAQVQSAAPVATTPNQAATPAATTPVAPLATAPATTPVIGSPAAPAPGTTSTTGSLRGRAVDPTNAVIPGANITLTSTDGKIYTTQSTGDGTYLIPGIAPGAYTVVTQINGFSPYTKANIKISAGVMAHQNLHLDLEVNTIVNVKTDDAGALSVNPDNNSSSVVLSGQALDALSDDPDELSDELSALAGPAAGPNGGQIYIDGFTGGELPPKNTIREIRINQNPFSAEYDRVGYGRIEILTKPGTDKLHGSINIQGNDDAFNTAALVGGVYQPPYHTLFFQGSLSGPLTKTASYNVGGNYRKIEDDNIVNTTIAPAPGFIPTLFTQSVFFPQTRIDLSPRLDLQIAPTNTLTARYQFDHNSTTNGGTGGSNLATAGSDSTSHNNEIQLSDSQTIGAKVVTETRFEYSNNYSATNALDPQFTNRVQGAFTDFGNGTGIQTDTSTHYELQSYTSVALKNNFIRFGGRLRHDGDSNTSTGGTYGSFTYGQNQVPITTTSTNYINAIGGNDCAPNPVSGVYYVTGICNYAVVQQQGATNASTNGFGPIQYNITAGPFVSGLITAANPSISASITDVGLYAEDDWKIASNFTLSAGIRYETQNHITDHHDFAPRLSIAWGLGGKNSSPAFVIRGGFGIFYDRFGLGQIENVARMNGVNEVAYTVLTPSAACIASPGTTNCAVSPSRAINYIQAPDLRAPYTIQSSGSIEHNLFKVLTLTFTYLNSRGEHQLFQQNTAFNTLPASGTNTYEYVSEGIFKQNQYIIQANYRGPANTSLFGYYVYGRATGDVSGTGNIQFPSNSSPNNIVADYGRASFDVRHRVFFGGSASFPHYITVSPFMIANSGTPFNITLGQDLNGDTIFNDRPAFCTASTAPANAFNTKYGCFDRGTLLSQARIPINDAEGPAQFTLNLRVTKTWGFGAYTRGQAGGRRRNGGQGGGPGQPPGMGGQGGGGRGGGGGMGGGMGGGGGANTGRRYNFTVGAQALNLFNVVNYATPQGVLSSPQFGQQTQLAGGIYSSNTAVRRVTLQASFTF
jgi:hypothetical protein